MSKPAYAEYQSRWALRRRERAYDRPANTHTWRWHTSPHPSGRDRRCWPRRGRCGEGGGWLPGRPIFDGARTAGFGRMPVLSAISRRSFAKNDRWLPIPLRDPRSKRSVLLVVRIVLRLFVGHWTTAISYQPRGPMLPLTIWQLAKICGVSPQGRRLLRRIRGSASGQTEVSRQRPVLASIAWLAGWSLLLLASRNSNRTVVSYRECAFLTSTSHELSGRTPDEERFAAPTRSAIRHRGGKIALLGGSLNAHRRRQ